MTTAKIDDIAHNCTVQPGEIAMTLVWEWIQWAKELVDFGYDSPDIIQELEEVCLSYAFNVTCTW